jgi:hypothetical protein
MKFLSQYIEMLEIKNYDDHTKKKNKVKIDPNLPEVPFRILLVGSSKSGKSTLLVNLLRDEFYGKVFKKKYIIVFSPTACLDPKIKQIGAGNVYDTFNPAILEYVMERQIAIAEGRDDEPAIEYKDIRDDPNPLNKPKKKKKHMENILIIFDDCLGMRGVFDSNSMLNKMIIKARHYNISVIISTQKLSGVGRTIRLNMSAVFIFRALNGNEIDEILDEFSSKAHRKHNYLLLTEYIWDKPYEFLYCKFDERDRAKVYRKGFYEVLDFK